MNTETQIQIRLITLVRQKKLKQLTCLRCGRYRDKINRKHTKIYILLRTHTQTHTKCIQLKTYDKTHNYHRYGIQRNS